MSVLTFINEEYVGYNLMLTIKIDDPISGSPASTYDIQQSFRLANSGMNVSKIDWGDGSAIDTIGVSSTGTKSHKYSTGIYQVKMLVTSMSDYLDLRWNNIQSFDMIPGILVSPALNKIPFHIDVSRNKVPKDGFITILNSLLNLSPSNLSRDGNPPLRGNGIGYAFIAHGQMGHIKYVAPGDSKGYYRTVVSGQEYLMATADDIANYSRSQQELDLFNGLINKNWLVTSSFDNHYRTTAPYNTAGIFNDGEMGDINIGIEQFHVVFTQSGNTLQGKLVRRNRINGLYNDERFPSDSRRQIAPQELYLRYQFKKPGDTNWGHDVWMNVSKTSPKIVDDLSINSIDYPEGTQVRAEYMGKYGLCSADVSDSYRNLMTAAPFQITLTYM